MERLETGFLRFQLAWIAAVLGLSSGGAAFARPGPGRPGPMGIQAMTAVALRASAGGSRRT